MIGTDTIRRHWPKMLDPLTTREWIEEIYSRRHGTLSLTPAQHMENDPIWADGYGDWVDTMAKERNEP